MDSAFVDEYPSQPQIMDDLRASANRPLTRAFSSGDIGHREPIPAGGRDRRIGLLAGVAASPGAS